jgi:hypothetical protein
METNTVPETLCPLEYLMINKVQKLCNPECYAPLPEPLEINTFPELGKLFSVIILSLSQKSPLFSSNKILQGDAFKIPIALRLLRIGSTLV